MSDSRRRYDEVRSHLGQVLPGLAAHEPAWLTNLSLLVSAIAGAKEITQNALATQMPLAAQDTSLAQRQRRWVMNERIGLRAVYEPLIAPFVAAMSRSSLPLILDTTAVGANCHLLTVSLAYQKRAVPLAWEAGKGKRGHTSAQRQQALLAEVADLTPAGSDRIVLGDGEFSSVTLLRWLDEQGWAYALRCAADTLICVEGEWRRLDSFGVQAGDTLWLEEVAFTQAAYGPVNILLRWDQAHERLVAIVSNLPLAEEVIHWYRKRFWTEPFYGDLKGHGFDLQSCRLRHPQRLERLFLAVALAYLWLVFLGSFVLATGLAKFVDRTDRRDHSIFTIGRRWLLRLLKLNKPLLVRFRPLTNFVLSPAGV